MYRNPFNVEKSIIENLDRRESSSKDRFAHVLNYLRLFGERSHIFELSELDEKTIQTSGVHAIAKIPGAQQLKLGMTFAMGSTLQERKRIVNAFYENPGARIQFDGRRDREEYIPRVIVNGRHIDWEKLQKNPEETRSSADIYNSDNALVEEILIGLRAAKDIFQDQRDKDLVDDCVANLVRIQNSDQTNKVAA